MEYLEKKTCICLEHNGMEYLEEKNMSLFRT